MLIDSSLFLDDLSLFTFLFVRNRKRGLITISPYNQLCYFFFIRLLVEYGLIQ